MSQLETMITMIAHQLLAQGRCTIDEVADETLAVHGELIDREAKALIHRQIKNIVKRLLAKLADNEDDDEAQQALPGMKLPSAIAVRRADGVYEYVRADMATWSDLISGLAEREQNITRAIVKRDQYRAQMDRLRPWMADDPTCTVAEALRRELG